MFDNSITSFSRFQLNLSDFRVGHKMGTSLRIFIVNDDDSLERIALSRYERMRDRDPRERLPEYVGKRIRYALVFVDLDNRQPVEILRIQYSYLYFDDEGMIEADDIEKATKLALEALPSVLPKEYGEPVIDARQQFAKRRFDRLYHWEPTPEIEAAIFTEIFGKGV